MPTPKEAQQQLNDLVDLMGSGIEQVQKAAKKAQQSALDALMELLATFEIKEGAFVKSQTLVRRIAKAERILTDVLKTSGYNAAVSDYLGTFTTVEARTIAMHRTFNDIQVASSKLSPARAFVLDQATHFLNGAGLAEGFVQPAKFLLMQQVVTGLTLADGRELLEKWAAGELSDGKKTSGRKTVSLEQYATQITRDSLFQYHGTINDLIRKEYGLDSFIYTGDIIKDSRPLCRYLVQRGGEVPFAEIPALISQFPEGTVPGTNSQNFLVFRGGYSCRHGCFPVRKNLLENTN
jgi:hypothetical protein